MFPHKSWTKWIDSSTITALAQQFRGIVCKAQNLYELSFISQISHPLNSPRRFNNHQRLSQLYMINFLAVITSLYSRSLGGNINSLQRMCILEDSSQYIEHK